MDQLPIGKMPSQEFDDLIETFIVQRSCLDDRLPGDVFFELLGRREETQLVPPIMESPARVRFRVREGKLDLIASPDCPLQIDGNRLRWADGHELILDWESPAPAGAPSALREDGPEWPADEQTEGGISARPSDGE
jgi:hypothetical protein